MRRSQQLLLLLGTGALVAGGSVGLAVATGSSTPTAAKTPAATPVRAASTAPDTVNVTTATVAGRSEQILVNAKGLPLYTYAGDTPTASHVSGSLAALWPPLTVRSPSSSGVLGRLSEIVDANGQQVLYDGHFLYTFVNDTPGQVTGQGVQGFFVATPRLTAAPTKSVRAPVAPDNSYGY